MAGFPLCDSSSVEFGAINRITFGDGRLLVEGWAVAESVGLCTQEQMTAEGLDLTQKRVGLRPDPDVQKQAPFTIDLPLGHEPVEFWALRQGKLVRFPLPQFTEKVAAQMHRRQMWPYFFDLLRAMPSGLRWVIYRDLTDFTQILTCLRLTHSPTTQRLNSALFAQTVSRPRRMNGHDNRPISIVMPVFNAFDLLPEVLDRVLNHTDVPWRLILIEDCSTDWRVRPWLQAWHSNLNSNQRRDVQIIENDKNIGFIGSTNRALATAIRLGGHVVLLNSDAFVPDKWASRLIKPLVEGRRVATVTAMSNDAEIFTAPVASRASPLLSGEADAIDAVAQQFSASACLAEAPTGVGYCMAIHHDYLKKIPTLDTIFGKGYGEEVDWCQRARGLGGRHLGHGGLFVEHRSGSSFGTEVKKRLIRNNNQLISKRYPKYDNDVQDFLRHDPLATPRLALALAWAAQRETDRTPVYFAHSLGGGAERYLTDRVQKDLTTHAAVIVLRVGGATKWRVEVHTPFGTTRGDTDDTEFLLKLLNILHARRFIYSCGVGYPDPIDLPNMVLRFASAPRDSIVVLFHDYLPISPSYTLLGSDGVYRGVPRPSSCIDPAHETAGEGSLGHWQEAWGKLLESAEKIIVFSEHSRTLVAEVYPTAVPRLAVEPHTLPVAVPKSPRRISRGELPTIGVLGNIGFAKGAAVLQRLSNDLAKDGSARIVVLGQIDSTYALTPPNIVHGGYQVQDIPVLIERYGISQWFLPSIWPETFSYTTHEALATGLPVWCFGIGAQGDAALQASHQRGQGGVIPIALATGEATAILSYLLRDHGALSRVRQT